MKEVAVSNKQSAVKATSPDQIGMKPETLDASKSYADKIPSVAAEKIMKEIGITAEQISPTGKGGRITKADVISTQQKPTSQATSPLQHSNTPTPKHSERNERREKMTMLRKKIAHEVHGVRLPARLPPLGRGVHHRPGHPRLRA